MDFSNLLEYGIVGSFDTICLCRGEEIAIYNDDYINKNIDDNNSNDDNDIDNDNEGITFLEIQFNYQYLAAQLYYRFGVREGDKVLLLLKEGNTAAEITAILACARLGAPFVPIDSSWIQLGNRFQSIKEDVNPQAAIVIGKNDEDEVLQLLANSRIYRCALINEDGSLVMQEASCTDIRSDLPEIKSYYSLQEDYIAPPLYILFTSGSSGKPKGVQGSHHGLLNRIHWQYEKFPYDLDEVAARRTPLTFVDSIAEILSPLLAGIPLWTIKKSSIQSLGLSGVADIAGSIGVTRLTILPSQLSMAIKMDKGIGQKWKCLKYIVVSGEPCSSILLNEISSAFPNVCFINLYGSTEVSGDVSYAILQLPNNLNRSDLTVLHCDTDNYCPIGIPIINNELFVVSIKNENTKSFDIVNDGDIGELLVAGHHLAWGYVKVDEMEENRFIDYPFGPNSSVKRVFRTGDLVKKSSTGVFTWIGRKDSQVKIRGMRIELEEVERLISTVINSFVGIAVVAIDTKVLGSEEKSSGDADEKRLIAFVESKIISEKFLPSLPNDLQRLFSRCLPSSFVPSLVLITDALPMTTSGKVDRVKLVEFLVGLFTKNAQSPPPSPNTVDVLKDSKQLDASIKLDLINLYKPILPSLSFRTANDSNIYNESFFSLGGDSMTAVEALWKIKKRWNLTIAFDFLNQSIDLQAITLMTLLEETKSSLSVYEKKKGIKRSFDWEENKLSRSQDVDDKLKVIKHAMASIDGISSQKNVFALTLKESWHYLMTKCIDSSPLIIETPSIAKLIIGDHSGQIIALDAISGSTLWNINISLHIENAVAINSNGDILYVSAYCGNDVDGFQSRKDLNGLGHLLAINTLDGSIKWTASMESEIKHTPLVDSRGNIIVGSYGGTLNRFNCDGELIDKINSEGSIYSKPIISNNDEMIYCGTTQGKLLKISTEQSMRIVWMIDVDAPIFASLALSRSDLIICGAVDGVLRAYSSSSQLVWTSYATRPLFSTPVISDDLKIVLFGSHDGYLRKVSLDTGELLFEVDVGSVIYASPFLDVSSNICIIATTSGDVLVVNLHSLDPNLSIITKFRCSGITHYIIIIVNISIIFIDFFIIIGEIYSSPIIYSDMIFVGCRDDRLYSIKID